MFARKEDLEKEILQKELQMKMKQQELLVYWVSYLFTTHHRCILTIIIDRYFRDLTIPIAEIEKFKNGANLLRDLEEGLLVSLVRKEKGAVEVRINQQFFTLLPNLTAKITSNIDPVIARLQRYGSNKDLRVCRGCQTLRTLQQIDFIGESCNCALPQFEAVVGDPPRLDRLSKLKEMLGYVTSLNEIINNLTADIIQLHSHIEKLNKRKLTEYEQFVKRNRLENPKRELLNMNSDELRRAAFNEVTGLMQLRRVEEMSEILAKREHAAQEDVRNFSIDRMPSCNCYLLPQNESSSTCCKTKKTSRYSPNNFISYPYEPIPSRCIKKEREEQYDLQEMRKEAIFIRRNFEKKEQREKYLKHMSIGNDFDHEKQNSQFTEASNGEWVD